MKKGRKCNCLLAALAAFIAILLITYVSGYTLGYWASTSWMAAGIIMVLAAFCTWCRDAEDMNEAEH